MKLEISVDAPPSAELLSWSPDPQARGSGLLVVNGGSLVLSNVILHLEPDSQVQSLLDVNDGHLVLLRCQLTVPPGSSNVSGELIAFRATTTKPLPETPGVSPFLVPVNRPVCRLIDTILIGRRAAIRAEMARGLIALTRCAVAAEDTAIELNPVGVARVLFDDDLWLERCTVVAGRSIVRLGQWGGKRPGPDRPWLVNSRHCAFLNLSDAKAREAVLLRGDADTIAGGCLFWQADGDAYELDQVTAAGDVPAPPTRSRDLGNQWAQFWGSNRSARISGPRVTGFRLRERVRPGWMEPPDLILYSAPLDVGADLLSLGVTPRPARSTTPRK